MSEEAKFNFNRQSAAPTISTLVKNEAASKSEESSEAASKAAAKFEAQQAHIFSIGSSPQSRKIAVRCEFFFLSTSTEIHNSSFLKILKHLDDKS